MGFIMPRIEGFKEIHVLYGVQSRRQSFPKADWAFLLAAAANCAAAFEALHARGHLVGDVNEGNLLVSPKDATVRLIDCDSFQLVAGNRVFLCDVGSPLFTPPELLGKNFKQVTRGVSHDQFGLAVLLFHLLFLGRHPFSGRYLGGGEMAPERAIGEHRFAFGRNATALQMAPPPFALPLSFLPPTMSDLFERAFSPHAERTGRPSAGEWRQQLLGLLKQLRTCPTDASHRYPSHLHNCAWCQMVADGGPAFFLGFNVVGQLTFIARAEDLTPFWAEVSRLQVPNLPARPAAPQAPVASPLAVDAAKALEQIKFLRSLCAMAGALAAVAALVGAVAALPPSLFIGLPAGLLLLLSGAQWWRLSRGSVVGVALRERQSARAMAQAALASAQVEWEGLTPAIELIQGQHAQLESLRRDYFALQPGFEAESGRLLKDREASQRRDFLRNAAIRSHTIKNIGDGRKAMLRSYHVETALDVLTRRIQGVVPGFGPALADALNEWARSIEGQFRFDAKKGVSEQERRALVIKYLQRQAQLKSTIAKVLVELRARTNATASQVTSVYGRFTICLTAAAQADADLSAVAPGNRPGTVASFWGGRSYWTALSAIMLCALLRGGDREALEATGSYPEPPATATAHATPEPATSTPLPRLLIPRDCTIRSAPSVNASDLGRVVANTPLSVSARQNGWRKVTFPGGQQGWTGPRCWTPLVSTGGNCVRDEDCARSQCSLPPEGETIGTCL
ncbi:SH3 domain-containing protein [Myxococcus eversor]|uniref:SH3 domain-containing protein n=1 Tax=Myxococcus eversor TaxID=2709661 RepID=UPI0013D2D4CE|nr:SH3 domain-containing protein [Myxococcus eversor]